MIDISQLNDAFDRLKMGEKQVSFRFDPSSDSGLSLGDYSTSLFQDEPEFIVRVDRKSTGGSVFLKSDANSQCGWVEASGCKSSGKWKFCELRSHGEMISREVVLQIDRPVIKKTQTA